MYEILITVRSKESSQFKGSTKEHISKGLKFWQSFAKLIDIEYISNELIGLGDAYGGTEHFFEITLKAEVRDLLHLSEVSSAVHHVAILKHYDVSKVSQPNEES